MPLPRGSGVSEMPQRLCRHSTHSRNASSESGGVQPLSRHSVGSPKFSDRRSLKGSAPERTGVNHELQKKSGSRISDLETQLGQVHDEVKKLKEQLASVQNAKKAADLELEENKKLVSAEQSAVPDDAGGPKVPADSFPEPPETPPEKEKPCLTKQDDELSTEENLDLPDAVDNSTRVDELIKEETEEKTQASLKEAAELPQEEGDGARAESTDNAEVVAELKLKMQEKEQELIRLSGENESLKVHLLEVEELKAKEEETSKRLSEVTMELEESNKKAARVAAQLEIVIQAKAELEEEMKRVRVQTEQWRKAAETAASVLAYVDNGAEMNRRSGSMNRQKALDKSGYLGLGSPLADDTMDDTHAEKRKGSGAGIKKIGDLWKKKGQK
ncbi:interactor of constitutive active ROPs 4-like isoform X2 [Nymphaea colorata]|uniref:interactor of constitutive active ROPs 4-like isoform X2 n=1 Tax=Nymphaea colorata TaxID=210225 RepID=UPI00129D4E48|nr:interactor of constitutive active ROPs 4-like isoform X2 [Nymphaea colorata]